VHSFAFKCHREGALIYALNAVDTHPQPEFHSVFSTAGADGTFNFWDKDKRTRLKEFKAW
jgi:mRNA export factor